MINMHSTFGRRNEKKIKIKNKSEKILYTIWYDKKMIWISCCRTVGSDNRYFKSIFK